MWPQRFCLPVTHDGMEGQKDQNETSGQTRVQLMSWSLCLEEISAKQNSRESFWIYIYVWNVWADVAGYMDASSSLERCSIFFFFINVK